MTTSRTKPCLCPKCGYFTSAAVTSAADDVLNEGVKPKPDDIGLCLSCGAVLVYTKDLMLRLATFTEIASLSTENREILRRMEDARRIIIPPGGIRRGTKM